LGASGFEVFLENLHGMLMFLVLAQRDPVVHLNLPIVLAPLCFLEVVILVGERLLVILSRS
jgi:hypothetical protein